MPNQTEPWWSSAWAITIAGGIVVVVIGLWLEYRSPWFARRAAGAQTDPVSPNRALSSVLLLFAAVGVPVAGLLFLGDRIAQIPVRTLSLGLLLYETLVLAIYLVLGVWLPSMSFGYRRRYLQYLIYRCRDFDVKGLST